MKLRSDPLIHFLLIGAAMFAVNAVIGRGADQGSEASKHIVVSAGDQRQLRASWTRDRGREPTDTETRRMVDRHVREEVLFREAMSLGLAEEDTVVRQRMITKIEYLNSSVAEKSEPTDADLRGWYDDNREVYRIDARVSFQDLFFDSEQRGEAVWRDARRALATLRADPSASSETLGDPPPSSAEFELQSAGDVKRRFGERFAADAFALDGGAWSGPLESQRGLHLVRIRQKIAAEEPTWEQVRERVERDWRAEQRRSAEAEAYRRLRDSFEVVIEEPGTESKAGGA